MSRIPPIWSLVPSLPTLAAGELRMTLEPAQDLKKITAPVPRLVKLSYGRTAGGMPILRTPQLAAEYLIQYCSTTGILDDPREHAYVLACNTKQRLLTDPYLVAIGSMGTCLMSVTEVYRYALAAGASLIIVAHTHPSGNIVPSDEDYQVTQRLVTAGHLIDIPLADHLILAGCHRNADDRKYFSFKEAGKL